MSLPQTKPILDFLRELYSPRGSHDLVEFILQRMPAIISGHNNCLSRYDPARRTILQMNLHTPFSSRQFLEILRTGGENLNQSLWKLLPSHRHSHFVLSHHFSRSEWENHPIYRDMFQHEGIIDGLTVELGDTAQRFMFCIHRDRRGFTTEEIHTFHLLSPHLVQAFANARILETVIPGISGSLPSVNTQVHHLGPIGHSAAAAFIRKNLARWHSHLGNQHPSAFSNLQSWVESAINQLNCGSLESAVTPFILHGPALSIRFRILRNWAGDAHLLTEETSPHWNLSPREQEILHWVRAGKTDREIATILDLSHHTVKEHLRRIYRKTGAQSRTAAARLLPNP